MTDDRVRAAKPVPLADIFDSVKLIDAQTDEILRLRAENAELRDQLVKLMKLNESLHNRLDLGPNTL